MAKPSVSIIIPTKGKPGLVRNCLRGLFRSLSDSDAVEVVVMEQGGEECKELIEEQFADRPVSWMESKEGWSYSEINNAGVAATTAPQILLLNNDTVPRKGFLAAMGKTMSAFGVGIVGAKLLFPTGKIQHTGVVFSNNGVPYHLGYGRENDGTFGPATRDDDYDAVTFACVLIRRSLWKKLGGLDTAYFFNYEDTDFCLKAREKGVRIRLAHRAVVTHLEGGSGEDRQSAKHSVGRNLEIFLDRWFESGRMEKILNVKLNRPPSGVSRSDRMNILFVPSAKSVGVPWWRMEQPARMIAKLELANIVTLFPEGQSEEDILKTFGLAEVAIFNGFWSEWLHRICSLGTQRDFAVVYDIDDHPIYMSPFAQAYKTFGTQEIQITANNGSKVWLWRDGENQFEVQRNMENRQRQMEILSLSDMLTTTTVNMHRYLKTVNQNVAMLPNGIDFDLFRPQENLWARKDRRVRIGWHGGDNHYHDIAEVAPWLKDYVNNHDVELVLFGAYYQAPFRGIDPNKVVEEGWVHVEAFPWKLASLGVDVGVIHLADPSVKHFRFGQYKSELKFLEFSALKIPSLVCGGRDAYACCTDGDNSLVYEDREDFLEKLDRLCKDADLRKTLGERSYDWVREYRDLEKLAPQWVEALHKAAYGFAQKKEASEAEARALAQAAEQVPDSELRPAGTAAVAEG